MSYPGGKAGQGTYQRLINLMPPHRVYVEPFLGGAAIMLRKRPAHLNVGLDLSSQVIDVVIARLPDGGSGELPTFSSSADLADQGERRRRGSRDMAMAPAPSPIWMVRAGNGLDYLERSGIAKLGDGGLVYCDPPYLLSTRRGRRRYEFEFADVDHLRLLRWARSATCRVMVSGYWSEMYGSHLQAWRCIRFQAPTRGGLGAECVWCNFPPPGELHDYRFLGENFRERERIARLKASWRRRLAVLPTVERNAILDALLSDPL